MPKIEKRFILTTDKLNRNGYWVKPEGIDITGFFANPLMYYDHNMNNAPIGHWQDILQENGTISAVPFIDETCEDEKQIIEKVKSGTLRAVSIGFRVLRLSQDPKDLKPGQTYPTVMECEVIEASIVPVPANSEAVACKLYVVGEDGKDIEIKFEGDKINTLSYFPAINNTIHNNNSSNSYTMKQKLITLLALYGLSLAATASEDEMLDKAIDAAKTKNDENAKLLVQLALKDGVPGTEQTLLPFAQSNPAAFLAWANSAKVTPTPNTPATPAIPVTNNNTSPVEGKNSLLEGIAEILKLNNKSAPSERDNWSEMDWFEKDPEGLKAMQTNSPDKYKALCAKTYGSNVIA